ncbi:MAG: LysM peptidoglycan-binding domain-containing protein [bacterium]
MNFDIASSLKTLAKGALLTSSCLLFHGCTTLSLFEKKQKPEITPESTIIETQGIQEEKVEQQPSSIDEQKLGEEQKTKIEKQHLRALPRRPVIEEKTIVIEVSEEEDAQRSSEVVMYTVQKGDVLSKIARKFHTTVDAIIAENHLKNKNRVFAGQVLAIPSNDVATQSATEQETDNGCYVVQKGDTLSDIAQRFNTSIEDLRKNNRLRNDVIYVGQKLHLNVKEAVSENKKLPQIDTEKYVVQSGDVLCKIAKRCGTSVNDLKRINNISNPNNLHIGQVLYIKAQPQTAEPTTEDSAKKSGDVAISSAVLDNLESEGATPTESDPNTPADFEDNFEEDLFKEENVPLVLDEVK